MPSSFTNNQPSPKKTVSPYIAGLVNTEDAERLLTISSLELEGKAPEGDVPNTKHNSDAYIQSMLK